MMTYQDVFQPRNSILHSILTGFMPPWMPDPAYNRLAHERIMSQEEIDLVTAWVAAGAPEGNSALAPTPPVYGTGSALSAVNWTDKMPDFYNPFTQEEYRCFVLPLNIPQDTFITGWEVIPGDGFMVHHVLIYYDESGIPQQLDNADPLPGYQSFGGIGSPGATLVGAWAPGSSPYEFPTGTGVKIRPSGSIIIQVHYPSGTQQRTDSTRVNLMLGGSPIREVTLAPALNHYTNINQTLALPPNQISNFFCETTIPATVTLLAVAPHMHMLGKSIRVFAVKPGNDTVPLVYIPNWNFGWQDMYSLPKALVLPAGTKIRAEAVYDNTDNNPMNPNAPPQWVYAGDASADEMLMVYFAYIHPSLPGDANIVIDTSYATNTHNDCVFSLSFNEAVHSQYPLLFPNPAEGTFYVNTTGFNQDVNIEIYDLSGRKVFSANLPSGQDSHPLRPQLPAGCYQVGLQKGKEWRYGKLIFSP
jgi:hypothetical protein